MSKSLLEVIEEIKNSEDPIFLERMSKEYPENAVLYAIAQNKASSENLLSELAKNDTWYVRAGVAENENTPPNILSDLSNDSDINVRRATLDHFNLPQKDFERLTEENPIWGLQKTLKRKSFFEILGEKVRNRFNLLLENLKRIEFSDIEKKVQNPIVSTLEMMGKSRYVLFNNIASYSPETPQEILNLLSRSPYQRVRFNVATNPNTDIDTLRGMMFDPSPIVRTAIVFSGRINSDVSDVMKTDPSADVRWAVAMKTTNEYVLDLLSRDKDVDVQIAVAQNPRSSSKILERLSESDLIEVKLALTNNAKLSESSTIALARLLNDPDEEVRNKAEEKVSDADFIRRFMKDSGIFLPSEKPEQKEKKDAKKVSVDTDEPKENTKKHKSKAIKQ